MKTIRIRSDGYNVFGVRSGTGPTLQIVAKRGHLPRIRFYRSSKAALMALKP